MRCNLRRAESPLRLLRNISLHSFEKEVDGGDKQSAVLPSGSVASIDCLKYGVSRCSIPA